MFSNLYSLFQRLIAVSSESILVFKEQEFYFGISPADFEDQYSLDQLEISPTGVSEAIWVYHQRARDREKEGIFLHLGALFGLSPIDFSHQGMVFVKELKEGVRLGLFLDNLTFKLPIESLKKASDQVGELNKLPPELPPRAVRQVLRYNRKNIILIDPVRLTEVYQLIAPERIRNLLKLYHQSEGTSR